MREWFTAQELAGLSRMPGTIQGVRKKAKSEAWQKRKRAKGKGFEFHIESLPKKAKIELVRRESPAGSSPAGGPGHPSQADERSSLAAPGAAASSQGEAAATIWDEGQIKQVWGQWDHVGEKARVRADDRLAKVLAVQDLERAGLDTREACKAADVPHQNYYRWMGWIGEAPRQVWAPMLLDHYKGRSPIQLFDPRVWEMYKGLYLARNAPGFAGCYRRVERFARAEGIEIPGEAHFRRRLQREFSEAEILYWREGPEACDKLLDHPIARDHSQFGVLEAINGDGWNPKNHVLWPDGEIRRPVIWNWQDIGSSRLLTWRADKSENQDLIRLTLGDLLREYRDIPNNAWTDNTWAAAGTHNTGGAVVRYQFGFKTTQEEPLGLFRMLGINQRFTRPENGRSKPVERAHRELRERIDNSPRFSHKGTKDDPIPLDEFLAVVEQEYRLHNAQAGRSGQGMSGRSFDQVFAAGLKHRSRRVPTDSQIQLCLLASAKLKVRKPNGHVVLGKSRFGENQYWCPELTNHIGKHVMARFDPADLHQPIWVYEARTGVLIGQAEPRLVAGWKGEAQMRDHAREMKALRRCVKVEAKLKKSLTAREAALMEPPADAPEFPDPGEGVVTGQFNAPSRPDRVARAAGSDVRPDDDLDDGYDDKLRPVIKQFRQNQGF